MQACVPELIMHGINPRFDENELEELTDTELTELKTHVENEPILNQQFTQADYNFILEEIATRFKQQTITD